MPVTRFHAILKEKIEKAVQDRLLSLASGGAQDYPQYRDNVGYLRGLNDALSLCDEIEKEFDA